MRISDWSSDVCSSDLGYSRAQRDFRRCRLAEVVWCQEEPKNMGPWSFVHAEIEDVLLELDGKAKRARYVGSSEERRVGKEGVSTCRSRWSTYPTQKKTTSMTIRESISINQ